MSSYVQIGDERRSLDDADQSWIVDQLARRRANGASTCIKVFVKTSTIDLVFATADCGGGSGGVASYTPQEQQLIEEWRRRSLNDRNFSIGNLTSFLRHVKQNA